MLLVKWLLHIYMAVIGDFEITYLAAVLYVISKIASELQLSKGGRGDRWP